MSHYCIWIDASKYCRIIRISGGSILYVSRLKNAGANGMAVIVVATMPNAWACHPRAHFNQSPETATCQSFLICASSAGSWIIL